MLEPTLIKTDPDSVSENTEPQTDRAQSVKGEQTQQNPKGLESTKGVNAFEPESLETDSFLKALIEHNQNKAPAQANNQAEVEALQQLITEGADPTQLLEETAAGEGEPTDGGGIYIPTIERTAEEVLADAGFDTTTTASVDVVVEEILITAPVVIDQPDNGVEIFDLTPAVDGGEATVYDANLSDGTSPDTSALTQVRNFTMSAPDGLGALTFGGVVVIDASGVTGNIVTTGLFNKILVTGYNEITGVVTYEYTLLDNEAHTQPDNDNSLFDSVVVVLTDSDGDTDSDTLSIQILDDAPTATDEAAQNVNEGSTVTGTLDFVEGADGASITHIGATALTFGVDDYSQAIDIGSGSLKVKADGSYSYTADAVIDNTNPVQDTATFTVTDGDGDTVDIDIAFNLQDVNVPVAAASAALVDDDGLAGGNAASVTGDVADANADSDNNESTFSGTLSFAEGGDTPVSVDFAQMNGETGAAVGQETVTYSWSSGTGVLTATIDDGGARNGTVLFTVTITNAATGAYTVALLDNVIHAVGNDENDATAALTFTVTDNDNSTSDADLTVTFDDDAPTATDEAAQNVNEGSTVTGTLDFVEGADGASITHIGATALTFGVDDYSQAIDIGSGSLKVKADGSYSYTADAVIDNTNPVQDTATFTVTDGDGDTVDIDIAFNLQDVNVPVAAASAALVDDDGLAGGNAASVTGDVADANADSDNNESTFSGTLSFAEGGDTPVSVDFAQMNGETGAAVGQETVTYSWSSGTGVLTATIDDGGARNGTVLFTVTITNAATGAYTVALLDNVIHAVGNDENDATAALTFTVTDNDNSTSDADLTVTFDDDAPTATDEAAQNVNEGSTVTGTLDFVEGADGASITHIGATALTFGVDDYSQAIDIGSGSLKVKADGSYSYTADAVIDNTNPVQDTATFTVTDGDGDTVDIDIAFNLQDVNVPVAAASAALVDDDGLAGGNAASVTGDVADANADSDNNESTFSGTLSFAEGGDTPVSVDFAQMNGETGAAVGQETVTYSWSSGTGVLTATIDDGGARNGTVLFTVTITNAATGAYTVALLDNVIHAVGNDENDATAALTFTVTDNDNSTSDADLTVTFDDDAPTATDEAAQNVNEGSTVTGTLDFVEGADGASITHIGATALTFGVDDYSQAIDIGSGSLKVKADGSYSYTADAVIDNTNPVQDTATFTVTDGDGDTVDIDIAFNLQDVNVPVAAASAALVDDDGLAGGNAASVTGDVADANADSDNNESTFSGTLSFAEGGDTPVSVDFAQMNGETGAAVGQETVTYSWSSGTGVLTATIDDGGARNGTVLFTVTITNAATGAYTVALLDNVIHAVGNDENDATAALTFTVTDNDNSTSDADLTVTFDDDAPTAADPENAFLANEVGSTLTGSLNSFYGADDKGTSRFAMTDESQVFADDGTTPVTVAGVNIYYYIDPNDSSHVVASLADPTTFDSANVFDGSSSQNDSWVFEVTLDVAADEYTVLMYQSVDAPFVNVSVGAATREAGGPTEWIILQTSATESLVELTGYEASNQTAYDSWLASGTDVAATPFKDMNGSLAGWGVNNNNHNQFEIVHVEFGDGNDATDDSDAPTTSGVTDLPLANGVTLDFSTNYSIGNIIDIKVNYQNSTSSVEQFVIGTAEGSSGDEYYFNGTVLIIDGGLLALDYLEAGVAIGSGKFNIEGVCRSLKTGAVDIDLDIDTIDDDGDVASSSINIQVSGAGLGTTFIGTTEGDVLSGGSGNDILIGGSGNDSLSGGSGNDTFKWQAGETGTDTITDWGTGTDKLDLSELLQGEASTPTALDAFLYFTYPNNSDTTLTIDVDGSGNDSDQVIVFEGVDLTQSGALGNDQAIIDNLLNSSQLITD